MYITITNNEIETFLWLTSDQWSAISAIATAISTIVAFWLGFIAIKQSKPRIKFNYWLEDYKNFCLEIVNISVFPIRINEINLVLKNPIIIKSFKAKYINLPEFSQIVGEKIEPNESKILSIKVSNLIESLKDNKSFIIRCIDTFGGIHKFKYKYVKELKRDCSDK